MTGYDTRDAVKTIPLEMMPDPPDPAILGSPWARADHGEKISAKNIARM